MGILTRLHAVAERVDPQRHVVEAIRTSSKLDLAPPKASQVRRQGFEYGVQIGGTSPSAQSAYSAERLQILQQLYQAYINCPWVSGPIDLIARTSTAGGLDVVVDSVQDHKGAIPADPPDVQRLKRLLKFTNPREDMIQMMRSCVIDLLLFGDAFVEIVTLLGEPVALYTLDATTITVLCDEHGEVSGYKQDMDGIRTTTFDTDQVIHISLDAPRGGVYGVSPAQKALLPVTAWLFTEATIKECFRRGDPPRLHVDLGSMKELDVRKWIEQYTVTNMGPKSVGAPVVTTGGGIVTPIDPRKVQDYLNTAKQLRDEIISCFGTPPSKLGIIETGNIGAGTGEAQDKAVSLSTLIPTPSGWTTMGQLCIGDDVLDEAGNPCKVTGTYEVPDADAWRLTFSDGTTVDCCSDHLWTTWTYEDRRAFGRSTTRNGRGLPENWPTWETRRGQGPKTRRTAEIVETLRNGSHAPNNHSIPVAGALNLPAANLPIDPYVLGAWLGDGTSIHGAITNGVGDEQIIDEVRAAGYTVTERISARNSGRTPYYGVAGLAAELRTLGALGNKHVPAAYLRASEGQRLALLQGLMDTDGGFSSGQQVLFRSTSEPLADAVVELARSLSQKPVKAKGRAMLNGVDCGVQYGVTWTPTIQVFRLRRKADKWAPNDRASMQLRHRMIVNAEKIPNEPMRCIRVDSPNHMYLVGEGMIPTHNTFRVNTIMPVQALVLEKFNFQIVKRGFSIDGWHLEFGEIDYRDSKVVEEIRDIRLRNGSYTLNRLRDEIGEPPIDGGDEAVLIDRQNIVLWSDMESLSKAGIAYKLKGTDLGVGDPTPGQPTDLVKPDVPPAPIQPIQPPDLYGKPPKGQIDPRSLPAKPLPAADRPGGPKDATQGKPPREDRYRTDVHQLSESWQRSYAARRRKALRELSIEDPPLLPTTAGPELPTDPQLDKLQDHDHHAVPDYAPEDLGLTTLNRIMVDPRTVKIDHSYQRNLNGKMVEKYAGDRELLAKHVGLVGIRSDGNMYAVSGQHHTAAAVLDNITEMTYQSFVSSGRDQEAAVYKAYDEWHDKYDKEHPIPGSGPLGYPAGSR